MTEAQRIAELQPVVYRQLQHGFEQNRLAHAYLFEGDSGTGKHEVALWLTKHLFCTNLQAGQPCNECNNCRRIDEGEHPDVIQIEPDGQSIKVEQIRQLQKEFSKSGFEANRKVIMIKEAEKMNISSANSLLKFLEEPPMDLLVILETIASGRILPTIKSRCQLLHFRGLSKEQLIEKLQQERQIAKPTAELLSNLTNSFDKAVEISQDEWFNDAKEAIQQWDSYLLAQDPQAFIYVQKKLTKLLKEKKQQRLALDILGYYLKKNRQEFLAKGQITKALRITELQELLLQANQKFEANVSFQNILEQLALRSVM